MEDRPTTVYILKHPKTKILRYIGSTTLPATNRLTNHVRVARRQKMADGQLGKWLVGLGDSGRVPKMEVLLVAPNQRAGLLAELATLNFEIGGGRRLLNRRRPAGLQSDPTV